MIRRRTGRVVVALGLAVGLATAASGIASAESPVTIKQAEKQFKGLKPVKEPAPPCPTEDGLSATEIKIGALIPNSGPSAASFGPSRDGLQARIDKANQEKEIGNRTIKLVFADDAAAPDRNLTAAQQLVEQEKVWAVVENSSAADASAKYLYDKGIPVVGWHLGLPAFGTYPNFFGWKNSAPKDGAANYTTRTIDFIKAKGGRNVALVALSQANSARVVFQNEDAVKRTKGMKVVYKTVDVPIGSTEFGAIAQQIKDAGADSVYTGMDFAQNLALANALKQAGANIKVMVFPGGYSPQIVGAPAMDGVYFGLEFKPFETTPPAPGYVEFNKWLPPNIVRSQVTAIGWLMGEALVQGIKEAGITCPTRKGFITNLRLLDNYSANGWFDPIDYSEEFNRPFPCAYYVQVVNKAFVPQFDGKAFCARQTIVNNKIAKQLSGLQAPPTAAATTPTTAAAR
jgi:ABC-type branched-subunit amino acid transport system substrate-binding protein